MRKAYRTPDWSVTSLFSPSRQRQVRIALACVAFVAAAMTSRAASPSPGMAADGWITHPGAMPSPVVLHFRRVLRLEQAPGSLPVTVTADNRFVLYVNGIRAASGPSTATQSSWRYSKLDLASYLKPGDNVIAAVVWNFGEAAPLAQMSVATGFRMTGAGVATGEAGWRVAIEAGRTADSGRKQIDWTYYVASAPEIIDAARG
jgi:alpha-L-rhamnosidase